MSDQNKDFSIDGILKLLQHRYPFVFVDRVISIKEGESIECIKNLTYNEPFFEGHFPKKAIMPGVLMIEALAQAAGILILQNSEVKEKLFFLAGVDKARFKKMAFPGDRLHLHAHLEKKKKQVYVFNTYVEVDRVKIMQANLLIAQGQVND